MKKIENMKLWQQNLFIFLWSWLWCIIGIVMVLVMAEVCHVEDDIIGVLQDMGRLGAFLLLGRWL